MRKLSYEIFDRQNNKIKEVDTYKELEEEKAKGNTFKCKLTEIIKRCFFDVYDGENFLYTVTTNRDKAKAKKMGYTIKTEYRVC